MENTRTK